MRVREYLRAEVADIPALEAAGWRVVAASQFALGEISVLLVREPPPSLSGPGGEGT